MHLSNPVKITCTNNTENEKGIKRQELKVFRVISIFSTTELANLKITVALKSQVSQRLSLI